jgi:hypothetical protein
MWSDRLQRDDYRIAILITIVETFLGGKDSDIWKHFPRHAAKKKQPEKSGTSQLRANMRQYIQGQKTYSKKG